jgi:RNA-directed DNA polymerase
MLTHRKIFMIALDIENHLGLLYATVVSKETYAELDDLVYRKLVAWATHRHPKKSKSWVSKKYWQSMGGDNWVFATRKEGTSPLRLLDHADTPIVRHVKVKGESSPYDANLVVRIEAARESGKLKDSPGKRSNASVHFLGA